MTDMLEQIPPESKPPADKKKGGRPKKNSDGNGATTDAKGKGKGKARPKKGAKNADIECKEIEVELVGEIAAVIEDSGKATAIATATTFADNPADVRTISENSDLDNDDVFMVVDGGQHK